MPLPTMLIAGAQKCGTSTLAKALSLHPQIFMTRKPKEVHFFDRHFDRGLDWYAEQFKPGPEHVHVGEASPVYMYDAQARRRMAQSLPDAKIVIILRDPSQRAYSHYWHRWRGVDASAVPQTFEEAIAEELLEIENDQPRPPWDAFLGRGHYLDQILAVVDGHGRANVHVMLLDDLSTQWTGTLRELFVFLDVDPGQAQTIPEVWAHRTRVKTKAGTTQRAMYPPMTPQERAALVEIYREDNERLAAWLGRDLSAWSSV